MSPRVPSILALSLVAACASQGPATAATLYEGAVRSRAVQRGAYVFHHVCAACHRGRVNPAGYQWTPVQMRFHIRNGNGHMPPIPESLVDDPDMEAVLAFLTTIGAVDGELPPLPDPPNVGGGGATDLAAPPCSRCGEQPSDQGAHARLGG